MSREQYQKTYTSFAGTDIVAVVTMPSEFGAGSYVLGELQTISYSIHRDVLPVRSLGYVAARGFTSGPRTIAGSLIFTVFNENVAKALKDALLSTKDKWTSNGVLDKSRQSSMQSNVVLMDELPPVDITIIMTNEYGQASYLKIEGMIFVDEGQTMSIEDMIVENTYSYMARDITPLRKIG